MNRGARPTIAILVLILGLGLLGWFAWYASMDRDLDSGTGTDADPTPTPTGSTCGPNYGDCPSGQVCIQECGPPVVSQDDPPPGYYCENAGIADQPRNCPICLAANTMIDTPSGPVNVQELHKGDIVWSLDNNGQRTASPLLAVSSTKAPPTHKVVHLTLSDGRTIWVSPNHPLTDGTPVGHLEAGDSYDGAKVMSAQLVPYQNSATYDLLPDSTTGLYWANGILLKSTLKQERF